MTNNQEKQSKKQKGRPKSTVIGINKPNFELMARAFINLYNELEARNSSSK